jgi:uncharacterized membrane protein
MIPREPNSEDMHKDPSNWKWGIFYYNKNDERLFAPKKNPVFGTTVNFANRYSILFFYHQLF